jgi:hypothetical protein
MSPVGILKLLEFDEVHDSVFHGEAALACSTEEDAFPDRVSVRST